MTKSVYKIINVYKSEYKPKYIDCDRNEDLNRNKEIRGSTRRGIERKRFVIIFGYSFHGSFKTLR